MNELSGLEALRTNMAPENPGAKDILARLNDEQKEAVCQGWGPSLIVAGAGSGKTTVLTRRVAYLIKELHQDADSIMAVTFTNKAAKEMKSRIETIVGDRFKFSWIGTFHSMCARLLRREIETYRTPEGWQWSSNFVIYDETDSLNVLKAELKKLDLDEKVFPAKEMRHAISALKNDGYTYNLYAQEAKAYRELKLAKIFESYQRALAQNNAFDFDDLINVFADLVRTRPEVRARLMRRFRHLMIDEFQDTNRSQYEFVRLLGDVFAEANEISQGCANSIKGLDEAAISERWKERSLMVVGDVDQSIYSWRKADYRIFLGFQNDFPNSRIIKLEENYRSTSTILDIANSIITNNVERIDKTLRCNRGKGGKAQYYEGSDQIDEAFYVVEELKRLQARGRKYSDATILYRTNAQSRAIEEVLIRSGVPYTVVGGTKFYDRQEIKDIIAYLKLTFNPKDGQSFNRVVNQPKRGIGKTSLERLQVYADERGISCAEACLEALRIGNISPKTISELSNFGNTIFSRWQPRCRIQQKDPESGQTVGYEDPISGLITMILEDTGYLRMLETDAMNQKDELAHGRIENVRELIAVAKEFEQIADEPDLESFLTRISLVSDLDKIEDGGDQLRLMTLHSAKGLEFPVVFLMGLEEGVLPHSRSYDSDTSMEEERRLMYVGVTRAEDLLYITRARKRTFVGAGGFSSTMLPPSRFLKEITPGLLTGFYPDQEGHADEDGYSRHKEPSDDYESYDSFSSKTTRDDDRGGSRYSHDRGYSGNSNSGGSSRNSGYGGNSSNNYGGTNSTRPSQNGGFNYGNNSPRTSQNGGSSYGNSSSRSSQNGGGDSSRSGSGYNNGSRYGGDSGRSSNNSGTSRGNIPGRPAGGGSNTTGGGARQPKPSGPQVYRNGQRADGGRDAGRAGYDQRREALRAYSDNRSGGGRPGSPQEPQQGPPPSNHERLVIGDVVQHAKFGVGKVIEVIGEGDKELYKIEFDADTKRLMDPRFAKLIKLT